MERRYYTILLTLFLFAGLNTAVFAVDYDYNISIQNWDIPSLAVQSLDVRIVHPELK